MNELKSCPWCKDTEELQVLDDNELNIRCGNGLDAGYEACERSISDDIHKDTASAVFGAPQNEITSEQRNVARAINFGIIYGRK